MSPELLKPVSSFTISGKLWIEHNGKKFFGPGPAELLERIERTGSINQAAKEMNMSYKKAWELVSKLNAGSAKPLVITQSGGEKGGGSVITDEARQWLLYHKHLRERFAAFLEQETKNLAGK